MCKKIGLYILSLAPLFLMMMVLTCEPWVDCSRSLKYMVLYLLKNNILFLISFAMLLVCCVLGVMFYKSTQGTLLHSIRITKIKNADNEYLCYVMTYIVPLICMDLSDIRYVIVLVILLIMIGYLFVRANMFYANPSLAFMGYKLYKVDAGRDEKEIIDAIIITRDSLQVGDTIKRISLAEDVYYVEKSEKKK